MSRVVVVPVLLFSLGVTLGCGDLSQEDLLFRAAVPPKQAVTVAPPGVSSDGGAASAGEREQALGTCVEGDLRCNAQAVAELFNGITFGFLDIVDAIAALPPTTREPGRRVWGPHYDSDKDSTFRFEMVRDGGTYDFCLHAARGRVPDRDARDFDCDSGEDDIDDGLAVVLSGSFTPSDEAGGGARKGEGTMSFDAVNSARFDRVDAFARSVDFVFNNTDENTNIAVDVIGAPVEADGVVVAYRDGPVVRDAHYDFLRDADGSGAFSFEFFSEVVGDGELIPGPGEPERIVLSAVWDVSQAGRARGVVDGGDIDEVDGFTVEQCWGPVGDGLATTFLDTFGEADDSGNTDACLFDEGLAPR